MGIGLLCFWFVKERGVNGEEREVMYSGRLANKTEL